MRGARARAVCGALTGAVVMLFLALAAARADTPATDAAGSAAPPAPPAKNTEPPPAAAKPAPPRNLEAIEPSAAVAILGKKVRDASNADMGMVVDVLVAPDGTPRAAVIDFGGFLGVGSRKIAIDWRLLQFKPDDQNAPIVLALNRAEVQAAPEYKPSAQPIQVVGPPPAAGQSAPDSGK